MESPPSPHEFVISIIASACNCSRAIVTPDVELASLGMDSLSLTTVATHFEYTFQQPLTEEQIQQLLRGVQVRDVIETLQAAMPSSGSERR